jgi:hypothetical protein
MKGGIGSEELLPDFFSSSEIASTTSNTQNRHFFLQQQQQSKKQEKTHKAFYERLEEEAEEQSEAGGEERIQGAEEKDGRDETGVTGGEETIDCRTGKEGRRVDRRGKLENAGFDQGGRNSRSRTSSGSIGSGRWRQQVELYEVDGRSRFGSRIGVC